MSWISQTMTLLLVILAIIPCSCRTTLLLGMKPTSQQLTCLLNTGYLDNVITSSQYDSTTDRFSNNGSTKQIAKLSGKKPMINVQIRFVSSISPALQAQMLAKRLKDQDVSMVWMYPSLTRQKQTNCSYWSQYMQVLKQNVQVPIGIYSYPQQWTFNFGQRYACPQLGIYPLLWYQIDNDEIFTTFGGWNQYDLRNPRTSLRVWCNTIIQDVQGNKESISMQKQQLTKQQKAII